MFYDWGYWSRFYQTGTSAQSEYPLSPLTPFVENGLLGDNRTRTLLGSMKRDLGAASLKLKEGWASEGYRIEYARPIDVLVLRVEADGGFEQLYDRRCTVS
jgi:hypothetical protein